MKQFLLFAGLMTAITAHAQRTEHPGSEQIGVLEGTETLPAKQARTTRPEAILWNYDFANGIPSTWIHNGSANGILDPDARFEYRGVLTTPDTNVGTRGAFKV